MNKIALYLLCTMLCLCNIAARAQSARSVTGTIKDSSGAALAGATISIKNYKGATSANESGSFTLQLPSGAKTIIISSIGYDTKEIDVSSQSHVSVTLSASANSMNEVVVTGFGVKKDLRKVSYSVQEVKGEDLTRANNANIVNALQGKVAGVMINQGASGPQSSSRIRIRGNSSISTDGLQSTQPLFVIDGVLIKPGTTGTDSWGGGQDYGNIMKNLNSDDYESLTVLKGAPATALYGSDALNGVVLITTKKGKAQKGLGISFSHTESFDKAYKLYNLQNDYGAGISTQWTKDGSGNDLIADGIPSSYNQVYSFGPKFDGHMVKDLDGRMIPWKANNPLDFFKTGRFSNTNVAVQGGNDRTTFRFSYSNLYNTSVLPRNSLNRNSFTLRATQKLSEWLNMDVSANYVTNKVSNPAFQGSGTNPVYQFIYYKPRSLDIDYWLHNYRDTLNGGMRRPSYSVNDPYSVAGFAWNIYEQDNVRTENNLIANVDLNAKVTSWLSMLVRANMNNYNYNQENKLLGNNVGFTGGSYSFSQTSTKTTRVQALLTATRALNRNLDLSVSAGGETYRDAGGLYNQTSTSGGLKIPGQFTIGNSVNAVTTDAKKMPQKRLDAIYMYGDLTWKNMLTFNFSARNDWSSTLTYADGSGHYSFFYPTAGLSWVFTELPQLKNSVLSYGKLRTSFGFAGRDVAPYIINQTGFYSKLEDRDVPGGRYPVYSFTDTKLGNKDIKPELAKEFEIGADLRFFKNRLGIDFTYYKKKVSNQVLSLPVPYTSGVTEQLVNSGKLQNEGIEILLTATPIQTKDFRWNMLFNFSRNKNKILELAPGVNTKVLELAMGNDVQAVARVGKDYGTIVTTYGFAYYQKVDAAGKPVADPSNGKKVIGMPGYGANDYTFLRSGQYANSVSPEKELGTMMEKFLLSYTNTINYKNFTFGFQLDSKIGGMMASATHQYGSANGSLQNSMFGRDKEHGGLEYIDDNGVKRDDGIIPDGVFADGITVNVGGQTIDLGGMSWADAVKKGYKKPKPAWQYYEDLYQWSSGIRELSVFENSWIALREVSIGYALPANWAKKIAVNNLRVSVVGRNLGYLYKTAKDGINPEGIYSNRQAAFAEYGGWPYVRSIGFTISANF
ncbi:MAG: SusC/RagA family TonB-linked outer membrane protein [Filimonas sp.]|nr:SusC/RagA family TonB-linked outer membrane protein [Filimonas sp.]